MEGNIKKPCRNVKNKSKKHEQTTYLQSAGKIKKALPNKYTSTQ